MATDSKTKALENKKESGKFRPMMTSEQKKKYEKRSNNMPSIEEGYYPETIRFTATQLPEMKEWEVGDKYEITLKVKMTAYEERKSESSKEKEEGRFEIISVKT